MGRGSTDTLDGLREGRVKRRRGEWREEGGRRGGGEDGKEREGEVRKVKGWRGGWKERRREGWKGEGWRDQKECGHRGSLMKALNGLRMFVCTTV